MWRKHLILGLVCILSIIGNLYSQEFLTAQAGGALDKVPADQIGPGLLVYEFGRLPTQPAKDGAFVELAKLGTPSKLTKISTTADWKFEKNNNAVAIGLLKIEKAGQYEFKSVNFYDRNALYVDGKLVCKYRDGEKTVAKTTLKPGYVSFASVGYVEARGSVTVQWIPPGATELADLPAELLFHRIVPDEKQLAAEEPKPKANPSESKPNSKPAESITRAPREKKTVELKLATPEEAFQTHLSAMTSGDWATAFSTVTKDSQLGMVRAAFYEVESASFSGSQAEFKTKRKSQSEIFKKYGVEIGRIGNPGGIEKPAVMADLKACYVDLKNWSAANNSEHNDFRGLLKHILESKEIQETTAKILCKPIQHDRDQIQYPVYILAKTGPEWQIDLQASHTAGFDRERDIQKQAAKSSTSGIRLKHVFSAVEKKPAEKHGIEITSLSFSPDSRRVAVTAVGQPVQIWDLEKPERIHSIPLPKSDFPLHSEAAWSPDGRFLAIAINAGDSSESLGLYSIQDKRFVSPLPKQQDKVRDLQWVGADRLFFGVSGWTDSNVQFGKTPPWKSQYKTMLKGHNIYDSAISPDGTLAAATTGEAAVLLGADGKEVAKLAAGEGNEIVEFAFSPTGKQLAIGRRNKLELYDTAEKTSKVLMPKTEGWVSLLAFTRDGAKLVVLAHGISILDLPTAKVIAEQKASASIAELAPSGKLLATGASELNGEVSIWELDIEVGPSLLPAVAVAPVAETTKPAAKTPAASQHRMWTSADGMFKIEAEFVQQKQGFVQLKRKDTGALLSIPIANLSPEDQELLKTLP